MLMRRGLGITRALIALNAIPANQEEIHDLPQSGPPYTNDVPDAHVALLVLKVLRNLRQLFRELGESNVDILGVAELLDAQPNQAELVIERLIDDGFIEQLDTGVSDGFGKFRATSAGLGWLEEHGAELPTVAQGFVLFAS